MQSVEEKLSGARRSLTVGKVANTSDFIQLAKKRHLPGSGYRTGIRSGYWIPTDLTLDFPYAVRGDLLNAVGEEDSRDQSGDGGIFLQDAEYRIVEASFLCAGITPLSACRWIL
jgi:hypothetical protein